jgi:glycosyltransferase involved in cell wall biosynthesis
MFSVIIPIYNHAAYLTTAVLSALRSPLVQEILLVDDGSQDGSARIANELAHGCGGRVRNLTEPEGTNRGAATRLNQLVAAASCDWVAVLNSDDAFVADRFEIAAAWIRKYRAEFLCGNLLIMDQSDRLIGTKRGMEQPEYPPPARLDVAGSLAAGKILIPLANQNFIATTSNMLFTQELHRRVGGFADLRYAHDWDFALRASLCGRCTYTPHFFTIYRTHSGNTIKEDKRRVTAEVRDLFARFLRDHPKVTEQAEVRMALAGNRYLQYSQSESCFIAGVVGAPPVRIAA